MQFLVLCAFVLSVSGYVNGLQCGEVASMNIIHQAPWLVFMEYYRRGFQADNRCGGTLISSRHVVTAAHCVKKSRYIKMVARLGEYDLNSEIDCVAGICSDEVVRIPVVETFVHPGYDDKEHDIAVLKLKKVVSFSDFVRPICLPSGHIEKNTTFIAAGWGEISRGIYSSTTKHIALPLFPKKQCQNAYPSAKLAENIICAGGEPEKDMCRGDSGGPLALPRYAGSIDYKVELWGVISSGYTKCGTEGKPGIYTSVIDHMDWIREVVSRN